jgi:hypothetical protein
LVHVLAVDARPFAAISEPEVPRSRGVGSSMDRLCGIRQPMRMTPHLSLAIACALLGAGCLHPVYVESGAYTASFHSARLNGEPVVVETFQEGEHRFRFEHATFVHEIVEPFQGFQFMGAISLDDEQQIWTPGPGDTEAFLVEMVRDMGARLPDAQCVAPVPDVSRGPSAWLSECKVTREGVAYQVRFSALPGSRGVLVQVGSWTSAKGKEWVEQFWASLKPVERQAWGRGAAPIAVTPPVGGLPERALNPMPK